MNKENKLVPGLPSGFEDRWSKKFLLNKFKEATIVSLTGLIIGSLPELYPHKLENLSTVFFMENLTDYIYMIIGLLFVILLNRFFKKNEAN